MENETKKTVVDGEYKEIDNQETKSEKKTDNKMMDWFNKHPKVKKGLKIGGISAIALIVGYIGNRIGVSTTAKRLGIDLGLKDQEIDRLKALLEEAPKVIETAAETVVDEVPEVIPEVIDEVVG